MIICSSNERILVGKTSENSSFTFKERKIAFFIVRSHRVQVILVIKKYEPAYCAEVREHFSL